MNWDEALACENPDAKAADTTPLAPRAAGVYCSTYRFKTAAEYESDFDWLWGSAEKGFILGNTLFHFSNLRINRLFLLLSSSTDPCVQCGALHYSPNTSACLLL